MTTSSPNGTPNIQASIYFIILAPCREFKARDCSLAVAINGHHDALEYHNIC